MLGVSGCISAPSRTGGTSSLLGIVYYRSERPEEYTVGSFYYYDFSAQQARPLTNNNVDGYTRGIHWSPSMQQFVYAAGDLSQAEIFTTKLIGGESKQLTSNAKEDTKPSWSPDGKQLVYTAMNEDMSGSRIYLMNADGTESRPLLRDTSILSGDTAPWSPDGQNVAVLGQPIDQPLYDKSVDIYIVDVKSGEIKYQLADGSSHLRMAWAPDGQQLAFTSSRDAASELFIWNLSTGETRKITDVKEATIVDWSPDGRYLAFLAGPLQAEMHLYIIQPNGQGLKNLTQDLQYATSDGVGMWSPDSRCLVFSAVSITDKSAPVASIYVINTQTLSKVKITDDLAFYGAGSWVWSADDNISCESIFQGK